MDDWKKKVLEGMKLIREGCKENNSWVSCCECPFDEYCTAMMSTTSNYESPDTEWKELK